jgi:adenylate cyclase
MSADQPVERPDFEAEGLLEGLGGPAREGRLRLLNALFDSGIGLEDLRDAATDDRLVILSAEHWLSEEPRYSAREIAAKVEIPLDFYLALRRAQGLAGADPDERAYGDDDLEAAQTMATFYALRLDRDAMLEVSRVLGRGFAQAADAVGDLFRETFIKGGVSEEELGLRNAQAAREWIPQMAPIFQYLLKQHVRERLRHQAVSRAMLEAGEVPGAQDVAISFADMAAFTRLGERMQPEDVGSIAGRLGELASECAAPPVRLVKTIGDAAMLVSPDAAALLRATLDLVEAASEAPDFPELHAGAAYGPALNRSGDWYGRTVNIASRITELAEPGSVVATRELCDATEGMCAWSPIGPQGLKGIDGKVEIFLADPAHS